MNKRTAQSVGDWRSMRARTRVRTLVGGFACVRACVRWRACVRCFHSRVGGQLPVGRGAPQRRGRVRLLRAGAGGGAGPRNHGRILARHAAALRFRRRCRCLLLLRVPWLGGLASASPSPLPRVLVSVCECASVRVWWSCRASSRPGVLVCVERGCSTGWGASRPSHCPQCGTVFIVSW